MTTNFATVAGAKEQVAARFAAGQDEDNEEKMELLNIVKKIVAEHGQAVLADPKRLAAFLADLARDVPKAQKNALIRCLECGHGQTLKNAAEAERPSCKLRLAKKLNEDEGLELKLCEETVELLDAVLFREEQGKPCKNNTEDSMEEKKVSEEELGNYTKHYDRNVAYRLLKKLRKATRNQTAIVSGPTGAIVSVLGKLLSALDNPETPGPLKALIIGAIGYIILPFDLIPDFIPVIGYADDLASAAGVVAGVAAYSNFSLKDLDAEIDREGA